MKLVFRTLFFHILCIIIFAFLYYKFREDFNDTLKRQSQLNPSSALRIWMSKDSKRYGLWTFRYTSAAHFIDYDDESTLSYLALMHGEVLGKKYKLEKRPDIV